jgi:hypothetical protein
MSPDEADDFDVLVRGLIVPTNVVVRYQGAVIESRAPVRMVKAVTLDTIVADADGVLRRRSRQTDLELYEPKSGERPTVYELGIPVVEHDGRFHINVMQKVPLNRDRDNLTPAYRKALNAAVVMASADLLTQTDTECGWVREALPQIEPTVAADLLVRRFGAKTAVYDPQDREASKTLQDEGYTIIHGRSLSVEEHEVVRQTGVFQPAGRIRPSGIECSADGQPQIPADQWTPAMKAMAEYTEELGLELLDRIVSVAFYDIPRANWLGCAHGGGMVAFNVGTLGRRWIEAPDQEAVDALLLHEFAHLTGASDHLTREFNSALERLGAKLRTARARLGTPALAMSPRSECG